jgi:hypothetical protein
MIRTGIGTLLDHPGYAEPDHIRVELEFPDPDTKPDRPLFELLRPEFVCRSIDRPERGGKDQVPRSDQVLKVPEVIDILWKKPYFAE